MITTAREEQYLAKFAGEDVPIPEPKTRAEMYLAKMAGMDVDPPAPITREEQILSAIAENGGGGSSDFSTANVTINNAGDGLLIAFTDGETTISGMFNSGTISAILYKGAASAEVYDESQNITINSGAATYPEPDNHKFVLITGDCTITIS